MDWCMQLDTSTGNKPEKEEEMARRIEVSRQTIQNVKKDFFETADMGTFLQRKKHIVKTCLVFLMLCSNPF